MVQLKIFLTCALALLAQVAIGAPVAKKTKETDTTSDTAEIESVDNLGESEGSRALDASKKDEGYGEVGDIPAEEEAEVPAAGGGTIVAISQLIETIIGLSQDETEKPLLMAALETLSGGTPSTIDEADTEAPEGKGADESDEAALEGEESQESAVMGKKKKDKKPSKEAGDADISMAAEEAVAE